MAEDTVQSSSSDVRRRAALRESERERESNGRRLLAINANRVVSYTVIKHIVSHRLESVSSTLCRCSSDILCNTKSNLSDTSGVPLVAAG